MRKYSVVLALLITLGSSVQALVFDESVRADGAPPDSGLY